MRLNERTRPWWTLAGACAGLFLLMMDSTVVALALPEQQAVLNELMTIHTEALRPGTKEIGRAHV